MLGSVVIGLRGRKRRRLPPIEWDGMVTGPKGPLAPEFVSEFCRRRLAGKELDPRLRAEDEEAKRTPIGGRQYHYAGTVE